ncbi:hypothetical protein Tco_0486442 [Tanacetum coccineum]
MQPIMAPLLTPVSNDAKLSQNQLAHTHGLLSPTSLKLKLLKFPSLIGVVVSIGGSFDLDQRSFDHKSKVSWFSIEAELDLVEWSLISFGQKVWLVLIRRLRCSSEGLVGDLLCRLEDLRPLSLPDPTLGWKISSRRYGHWTYIQELVPLKFEQGDWFSFAKREDPAPVCMEVAKFGLKLWKENFFLIDRKHLLYLRLPKETTVTRPDRKVVTEADRAAKRKASTGPKISTNAAKMTRSSKKGSGAGSSGQAAGDEVEQRIDGTLMNDDQARCFDFAMEGIKSLNDVNQSISEDASPHVQEAAPAPDAQHLDADAGVDEIFSDGNVDPFYEAHLVILLGMFLREIFFLLSRGLITFLILMTKALEVSLLLTPKMIGKKFMESILVYERKNTRPEISTKAAKETISSKKGSGAGSSGQAAGDEVEQADDCTLDDDDQHDDSEFVTCDLSSNSSPTSNSRLTAQLWVLKSRCQMAEQKLSKLRRSRVAFPPSFSQISPLVRRFLKSGEFNWAFAGVLNMAINVRVERGLRMDHTNEEFRELSQRFVGFIPDAKEKFNRVVTAFPDTTFPFLDKVSQNSQSSLQDIARLEPGRVTPSHQTSSATTSLGANTHVRHSTSSSGNFGHTSTLEHLKKKKKPVEKGGPSAV